MRVAIVGAGATGALTALMSRRDGHDVTVIEQDAIEPPNDAEAAWFDWERRGVAQIRQPHALLGRASNELATQVPDVWDAILGEGITVFEIAANRPAPAETAVADRCRAYGVRRTTMQMILHRALLDEPDLTVRRGAVRGLVADRSSPVPRVTGVELDEGSTVEADLVVDASGRRAPCKGWLTDLGRPPVETTEDDGFVYYTRGYHHRDGLPPSVMSPFVAMLPGLLVLRFPADHDTFSIALVARSEDRELRRLRDPESFAEVVARLPLIDDWVSASDAISDVTPMASIASRSLRLRTGDQISASGIVNVGDSIFSTNPSIGRGISLGVVSALALRDLLRDLDDPAAVSRRFADFVDDHMEWLDDSIQADADTRSIMRVVSGGEASPPSVRAMIQAAAMRDADIWDRWTSVNACWTPPSSVVDDVAVQAAARDLMQHAEPPPPPMMTRAELVELIAH